MIEHVALNVAKPAAMAQWYCQQLSMKIVRHVPGPADAHFLADSAGHTVLEIYCNPPDQVPDYANMDPLLCHIAFASKDVVADFARLLAAGATAVQKPSRTPTGDTLAMLRDPWGLALQLAQRAKAMI